MDCDLQTYVSALCYPTIQFMGTTVDGEAIGTGSGTQKWQAKDAAAKEALQKLNPT
jgi:dsRNA-specific ribonuclease